MRKNGLRAIGLSFLAVLGLMAFMAAGAQATWLENLAEITANKEVLIAAHTDFTLDIPVDELEILCKKVVGDDLLILGLASDATATTGVGTLLFSECETFKKVAGVKTLQKLCKPIEPIAAPVIAHLILNGGRNEILLESTTGLSGTFTTIKFPETCALPLSNKVGGTIVLECLNTSLAKVDCNEDAKVHLLQQDTSVTADELKYGSGEKLANLLGVAKVELASKNFWAGHI